MNKRNVHTLIVEAFYRVELGDGIGLWEAQAIDDYEPIEIQEAKRKNDRTTRWIDFDTSELARCESSLSFFDANGMRFHLPAFILNELEQCHDRGVVFHLVQLDAYAMSKLVSLSPDQRKAIRAFLNWCLSNFQYKNDWPDIRRALDDYWQGDTPPAIIEISPGNRIRTP